MFASDNSENEISITVKPSGIGKQLVRTSIPFPKGFAFQNYGITVYDGDKHITADLRPLTWHLANGNETKSVRRGIVTFPYEFSDDSSVKLSIHPADRTENTSPLLPLNIELKDDKIIISYSDGVEFKIKLLSPYISLLKDMRTETIESSKNFLWQRIFSSEQEWQCITEIRVSALGEVVIIAHLQCNKVGFNRAPDFGWEVITNSTICSSVNPLGEPRRRNEKGFLHTNDKDITVSKEPQTHSFADGDGCTFLLGNSYRIYHPTAHFKRRGMIKFQEKDDGIAYQYWRCKVNEQVPMQQSSWRRAEIVIAPKNIASLTATLEYPHEIKVNPKLWDELYNIGQSYDLKNNTELAGLLSYHHNAIICSVAQGDDWGNITSYSDASDKGGIFGMNRLNHCPAIFREGYRSGDRRLIETATLWCDNFYDLSIWWGPEATGGTRYNNVSAAGGGEPDNLYMWRSNNSVHFCTKGYDSFFMAYEQTGDPCMLEALDAQVRYAKEYVHTDRGEARNIGDVSDFVKLYEFTGEKHYLNEALRLFRELRTKLSEGDLFSQSGHPIVPDPPFINDDDVGYKYPFAKPYIIGYALTGLPELLKYAPDEPKLRDVIQAVADFLSESQDPLGGWRYPHPRSAYMIMCQAMEHAWQITQADKVLGAQDKHLDAIERVLRQRLHGWLKTGKMFQGMTAWESATGKVKESKELYNLYNKPLDRDYTRDYTEGKPGFGGSSPEGLVYFSEVLEFYLKHRPAERLLSPPKYDEPLGKVLKRY